MLELAQKYTNIEEVLVHIKNGIIVPHQRSSGCFLMLDNLLDSYLNEKVAKKDGALKMYSVNELHPLYSDLYDACGKSKDSAVIIVVDDSISEIISSPISKNKLISSLQTNGLMHKY